MKALPPALWATSWQGVEICVFATGEDSPLSLAAAAAVLNEEEHGRAARFHFVQDRERWMRSRALLRMVLAERAGMDARELQFVAGEFGKLELAGDRMSPLRFNLSHSGDFAAVALAGEPVGVDIECWKELPAADLAAFAFRPEEHGAIISHAAPSQHFLELWTAKEAVMKCTGQGLSLPPASVIIHSGDDRLPVSAVLAGDGAAFALHSVTHPGMWVLAAARRAHHSTCPDGGGVHCGARTVRR